MRAQGACIGYGEAKQRAHLQPTMHHNVTYTHSLQEIEKENTLYSLAKRRAWYIAHTMIVELEMEMEAIAKSWSSSTLRMH